MLQPDTSLDNSAEALGAKLCDGDGASSGVSVTVPDKDAEQSNSFGKLSLLFIDSDENDGEIPSMEVGCLLIKFQPSDPKIPLKTLETDDRSSDIDDFFDGRLSDDVVVVTSLSRVAKSQTLVEGVEYKDCSDTVLDNDTLGSDVSGMLLDEDDSIDAIKLFDAPWIDVGSDCVNFKQIPTVWSLVLLQPDTSLDNSAEALGAKLCDGDGVSSRVLVTVPDEDAERKSSFGKLLLLFIDSDENDGEILSMEVGCLLIKFQPSDPKIPLRTLETDDTDTGSEFCK